MGEPYYLRAFSKPLIEAFHRHQHLWTEEEREFLQRWNEALPLHSKGLFARLAGRRSTYVYKIHDLENRYVKDVAKDCKDREEAVIELRVCLDILVSQHFGSYIAKDDDIDSDIFKEILKGMTMNEIKTLLKTKPMPPSIDAKAALKRFTRKADLIPWLVKRVESGSVNVLTKRSAKDIFKTSLLSTLRAEGGKTTSTTSATSTPSTGDVIDSLSATPLFRLNRGAVKFFRRLHLLSHLTLIGTQFSQAKDDDDEALDQLLAQATGATVLSELSLVEYVDTTHQPELRFQGPFFETRASLEEYELAMIVARRAEVLAKTRKASATDPNPTVVVAKQCLRILLAHVGRLDNRDTLGKPPTFLTADEVGQRVKLIFDLTDDFPQQELVACLVVSDDESDEADAIMVSQEISTEHQGRLTNPALSSVEKLEHVFLRRLSAEYLYALALYDLCDILEAAKMYQESVAAYELLIMSRILRSKAGKILLRLMIDYRLHIKVEEAALRWGAWGLTQVADLQPGVAIDLSKKFCTLYKKQTKQKTPTSKKRSKRSQQVIEINDTTPETSSTEFQIIRQPFAETSDYVYKFARGYYTVVCAPGILDHDFEHVSRVAQFLASLEASVCLNQVLLKERRLPLMDSRRRFVGEENLVAVEGIVLEAYKQGRHFLPYVKRKRGCDTPTNPTQESDTAWEGCHSEGAILREFIAVLMFPIMFNANVAEANKEAFLSDIQDAPADLHSGSIFIEKRHRELGFYLNLLSSLSRSELLILVAWASSHLYEIRLPNCKWNKAEQYPDVFCPVQNFASLVTNTALSQTPARPSSSVETPHTLTLRRLRKTPTSKWETPTPQLFSKWVRSQSKLMGHSFKQDETLIDPLLNYVRPIRYMSDDYKACEGTSVDVCARQRRQTSGLLYGLQLGWTCLGLAGGTLGAVAVQLSSDWSYWSAGLPDLHLWAPVQKRSSALLSSGLSDSDEPLMTPKQQVVATLSSGVSSPVNALPPPGESLYASVQATNESLSTSLQTCVMLFLNMRDQEPPTLLMWMEQETQVPMLPGLICDELSKVATVVNSLDCESAKTLFTEVKGPGDSLAQKQRLWLDVLRDAGQLCWVEESFSCTKNSNGVRGS
eukprot:Blabericola_migrator_1__12567@NODE_79_length_15109_cov_120_738732_g71_i0_p1_GENE_NODE_79_length_15109_cov_120_738732_g71_i0NODE_79_length_15109_cov_120_738732_g71_i0_p1_ORF_typecomplete_len1116_score227_13VRR_NUC/PF08774_11/4_5e13_NODE_79_length_15109_cov_120_738732_g71_i055368883